MNRNLDALDALKGIAALMVAFFHWSAYTIWAGNPVIAQFYLFVDFFFVLTGFVLAEVYRERISRAAHIGVFAVLRLARILPIHLFFILPLAGIEGMKLVYGILGIQGAGDAFGAAHLSSAGLLANLSLTHAFGWVENPGWNQPSWYIAIEFWTSLLFALICWTGLMNRAAGRMLLALISIGALLWMIEHSATLNLENGGAFARCLYSFGIGVAVQSILSIRAIDGWLKRLRRHSGLALEIAGLGLIAGVMLFAAGTLSFAAPVAFGIVVLCLIDSSDAITRLLRRGLFKVLAKFSYSIYMSHFLFILPLRSAAEANGPEAVVMLATYTVGLFLAATLMIGVITEKLVEAPIRILIRKWINGQLWAAPKSGETRRGRGRASRV